MPQQELDLEPIKTRNRERMDDGPDKCCGDDPSWEQVWGAAKDCHALISEVERLRAAAASSPPPTEPSEAVTHPAFCNECGLNYEAFPLDVSMPDADWKAVCPEGGGVLCARCIVARAAKIEDVIVVEARLRRRGEYASERVASPGAREAHLAQRVEDYRSGYSAGWSDGRNSEPMQDAAKAALFFGQQVGNDEEPCPVCGCEERHPRTGLLTCECPAPLKFEARAAAPGAPPTEHKE